MSKVKIRQVRSSIDRSAKQKRTLKALGLNKINGTAEHELNDTIRGMIFKVSHLIEVEELGTVHEPTQSDKSQTQVSNVAVVVDETVIREEE